METIRTTITVEETETWMITRRRHFSRRACPQCGRDVSVMPPEDAAMLMCRDLRSVEALIAGGDLHIVADERGKLLVCLNSLCSI
ncbi:MAG TPA: hypothetical protein VGJ02_06825 [Pyrinomonadaceae bacterium]